MSAVVHRQTARWLEFIYGGLPDLDDPAEAYHESSKVSPSEIGRQFGGARRLASSPELLLSSMRAVKRHGAAHISLPDPPALEQPLGEAIARRRSQREFDGGPIAPDALSALLHAGYGVTHVLEAQGEQPVRSLRAVPSGGALYPLELYAAVLRVGELSPGLYHFDPPAADLEVVRPHLTADELGALSTHPEVVCSCAVLILVAAIFGRARFKYGLRSYRFALLEAGHVAQNVLLAAAALGLAAVPLGAFYDRRTDEFLLLDGVNESTLYTIALGAEPV